MLNLAHGNKNQQNQSDTETSQDQALHNEKLLQRLTAVAYHQNSTIQQNLYQSDSKSKIMGKSNTTLNSGVTHEEWIRRKEHETTLKDKLIKEAKKDLCEQLQRKREEE